MILSICNISFKVEISINWSINEHDNWDVECETEHKVASKVVEEHVVRDTDLMLSAQEVEDCNDRNGVIHTDGHLGEHCPGLRTVEPSECLSFTVER